jgi:hypothetical protein
MVERAKDNKPTTFPVLAYYGTGRLWRTLKKSPGEPSAKGSRFLGYKECLNPATDQERLFRWFKSNEIAAIQKGETRHVLEAVRRSIVSMIPAATKSFWDVDWDELTIEVTVGGVSRRLPFHLLSDGYRNMVGMAADIAYRMAVLNPHLLETVIEETPGIVLIDEIDLHLYPIWQRQVVGKLLHAFPMVQFVATTHSPFIIQSLHGLNDVMLWDLTTAQQRVIETKSIEDIAEEKQGVEIPQQSQRFLDMMRVAEEYDSLLRQAEGADPERREELGKNLELSWDNFLLGCRYCNSVKGDAAINLEDFLWPDRDNTFLAFTYALDQSPQAADGLATDTRTKAERTLLLTGLDRQPGNPRHTAKDRRWLKRREAWGKALLSRGQLAMSPGEPMRQQIILNVLGTGFWSVWMTVFHDDRDLLQRLVDAFPGTDRDCFDSAMRPIRRRDGQV